MIQLFPIILALLQAIPILDRYFQELTLAYIRQQKEKNNVVFKEALDKAFKEFDATELNSKLGDKLHD